LAHYRHAILTKRRLSGEGAAPNGASAMPPRSVCLPERCILGDGPWLSSLFLKKTVIFIKEYLKKDKKHWYNVHKTMYIIDKFVIISYI